MKIPHLSKKQKTLLGSGSTSLLLLAAVLLFYVATPPVSPALAYDVRVDNSVDADSDVDSTSNIGTNDSSYVNAQSLDGTDQVIQEVGGYDFKIIRGTTVVAGASATITEGTDYTLEPNVTIFDAFIRITGAWSQAQGQTGGGAPQDWDQASAHIWNPEELLTNIVFMRGVAENDTRVTWEIIQYTGEAGEANEIIVRHVDDITVSGTQANGSIITTISDIDKTVAFLTGQRNSAAAVWPSAQGYGTLDLVANASNWQVRGTRGITNNNWYFSYAAVEFTGSNWRDIQRVNFTSNDHGATLWTTGSPGNSGTYSIPTTLLDASKAFLHVQFRHLLDWSLGPDDFFSNIELTTSTTQFTTRRTSNYADSNAVFVVWVMENTQTGSGEMIVEHIAGYRSDTTGSEEKIYYQAITTVEDINRTSIMGETSSTVDITNNNVPVGHISMRLTEDDNVTLIVTELDYEERYSFDAVQWPTVPPGGGGGLLMSKSSGPSILQSSDSYYYYEIMPQRGQTYRHFYNSTSDRSQNRYTYQSDYAVKKSFPWVYDTPWVLEEEYPIHFRLRNTTGTIFRLNVEELLDYFNDSTFRGQPVSNDSIWTLVIEGFSGLMGFYLNPNDVTWGDGQIIYYPRLWDGTLPSYNLPLYAVYSHLFLQLQNDSWRDRFLRPDVTEIRNTIHIENTSSELRLWYEWYGVSYLGRIFDFEIGFKYTYATHKFGLINNFRCRDADFKDVGWGYEFTYTPQAQAAATAYKPSKIRIYNATKFIELNVSDAAQAGTYLDDFYSVVSVISENGYEFDFLFSDMEDAGFTQKYLEIHDQLMPDLSTRKVLLAGMYGFGSYTQNTIISIDPIVSEKQETDARDFYSSYNQATYTTTINEATMQTGLDTATPIEYHSYVVWNTGITSEIGSTSNAEITFYVSTNTLEASEYIWFGLYYNSSLVGGFWNESYADANDQSAFLQTTYWNDSSFLTSTSTETNITITDVTAGSLVDAWVANHNADTSRSYVPIQLRNGTAIDSGENDRIWFVESANGTSSYYPTLSFDYVLSEWGDWSFELLDNEGFEDGNFNNWTTYNEAAGTWTAGTDPPFGDKGTQAGSYAAFVVDDGDSADYVYQDANVTAYSSYIDDGRAVVNASGWRVTAEDDYDETRIVIQALNSGYSVVSTLLDTGFDIDLDSWTKEGVYNTSIPATTRYIRMWGYANELGWDGGSVDSFSVKIRTKEASRVYRLTWEHQAQSIDMDKDSYNVSIYGFSSSVTENFTIQLWNTTDSSWVSTSNYINTTETWYNYSIDQYSGVIASNITWRYLDLNTTNDDSETTLRIDYAGITAWNFTIDVIETTITITKYNPGEGNVTFPECPLEINISSGIMYDIQIRAVDGDGSPVSNNYLWFDTDNNPVGATQLTTTYQDLYLNQAAGETTLNVWIWVDVPWGIGDQTMTFTLWVQIVEA